MASRDGFLNSPPAFARTDDGTLIAVLFGLTLVASTISSLGAPLLPAIAGSLEISLSSAQWSLTSALLAAAVSSPVLGRIGDGPYRREAIIGALVVVCFGGVIAWLAQSLPVLIVGRVMQGVGFGLVPIGMAAARDHLPADRSPAVIGLLSVGGAAGVGLGYPVSGLIASRFDVHDAFLFGALMSAIALVAAILFIPSSRESRSMSLDVTGAVVGTVGLVALLLAIGQGEEWGWGSPAVIGCVLIAVVVLTLWSRSQLRRPVPLVDLRQLRHRSVLGANLAAILLGVALYVSLTVVTEFVQVPTSVGFGLGASVLVAGLCVAPLSLTSLAASRAMIPLLPRLGSRSLLLIGIFLIAAAEAFFAFVHAEVWQAGATMALIGVGFGFTFGAIPGLISRAVPANEVGSALGFYQVIRAIGFAIGSASVASILAASETVATGLPSESGYAVALWVGVFACLLAAVAVVAFSPADATKVD